MLERKQEIAALSIARVSCEALDHCVRFVTSKGVDYIDFTICSNE